MSIEYLQYRLWQLQNEQHELINRRDAVERIIRKIDREPVNDLADIKKAASKTATTLSESALGSSRFRTITEATRDKSDSYFGLNHWEEKDYLNREINRINTRINELSWEISSVKAQIEAEREAQRRAQEERLRALRESLVT